MFTGIIEERGQILSIKDQTLKVKAKKLLHQTPKGGSVSLNGVCLTVVKKDKLSFSFEVMPQTIDTTNLKMLKEGQSVNLETPLTLAKPIGGHMLAGHVDGIGEIITKTKRGNSVELEILSENKFHKYIIEKGFVAIDGISLTIAKVLKNSFLIALVPETQKHTTLAQKKVGEQVNIEVDFFAKYVEKLCHQK